jgi:hypothetical protein
MDGFISNNAQKQSFEVATHLASTGSFIFYSSYVLKIKYLLNKII